MSENKIASDVVNASYQIHKEMGPGLFESVYEEILVDLLSNMDYSLRRQQIVPVVFRGQNYKMGFRADLIVDDLVLIELKSVERLLPLHHKQALTYMKLLDVKLGLLINFNVPYIRDGIRRIVNKL